MKIEKADDFKKMKPSEFSERYFNVKLYPYQRFIIDNYDKMSKLKRRVFK
ncbi:hypothetical protein [Bacillus sp. FJAT-22090]|nr:hypothetical protein [Bacillus sp. FJAT-22090]